MKAEDLFPTLKKLPGEEIRRILEEGDPDVTLDAYDSLEADCRRVAEALYLESLEREIRNKDAIVKSSDNLPEHQYQENLEYALRQIAYAAVELLRRLKKVTNVD